MSYSSRIAHRDFPPYFLHPRANEQLTAEAFEAIPTREMEQHESIGLGHVLTKVHLAQAPAERRFILEVVLNKGRFFIESLCTYTPAMGMDLLDGNLVLDAEEWILIQELKMKPRRLGLIFGANDRIPTKEYIQFITSPHAGERFQDVPVEFENAQRSSSNKAAEETSASNEEPKAVKQKKWWQFW